MLYKEKYPKWNMHAYIDPYSTHLNPVLILSQAAHFLLFPSDAILAWIW